MRPDALYAYVWSPVDVSKQQGEVFVAPFAVRLPFVSEPFHDGVAIPWRFSAMWSLAVRFWSGLSSGVMVFGTTGGS